MVNADGFGGGRSNGIFGDAQLHLCHSVHRRGNMKKRTFTEVCNNAKPTAHVVPVTADLPSWKRRKVQPLVLSGVSASSLILEERKDGR